MTERVMVNGAQIERSFLEENVAEAREYVWVKTRWDEVGNHGHCMVCSVTLSGNDLYYRSDGGVLDAYCFETFVSEQQPETRDG